jgi:hypothetical protein
MSQRSVEQVIGRLVSDEEFRRGFEASRETVLDELISAGLWLTPFEHRALLDLELEAFKRFAGRLDRRLRKIGARIGQSVGEISFGV